MWSSIRGKFVIRKNAANATNKLTNVGCRKKCLEIHVLRQGAIEDFNLKAWFSLISCCVSSIFEKCVLGLLFR